jgi:hemolysin III
MKNQIKTYSIVEERINVVSHAFGFYLSILALAFLTVRAIMLGGALHIVSFVIFGLSLIVLYSASTLYHRAKEPEVRGRLKIFDHASIYVLIAGSYTPFTLVTLTGTAGSIVSTIMYVVMGWVIVFAIKPLIHNLPHEGIMWLFGGGVAYTVGAILYSIKYIKFNHAIFHILVLIGSFCHFMAVYFYV